jgi:tRNA pseudouridine-54 N-methylase
MRAVAKHIAATDRRARVRYSGSHGRLEIIARASLSLCFSSSVALGHLSGCKATLSAVHRSCPTDNRRPTVAA